MNWAMPAPKPATRSQMALLPIAPGGGLPRSLSTPSNAAHAETFERKSFDTLKIVRNQPLRVRLATPSASPIAATAAPIGPRGTERPRWTKTDGDQMNVDPGRLRTAYTASRKVAQHPAASVCQSPV